MRYLSSQYSQIRVHLLVSGFRRRFRRWLVQTTSLQNSLNRRRNTKPLAVGRVTHCRSCSFLRRRIWHQPVPPQRACAWADLQVGRVLAYYQERSWRQQVSSYGRVLDNWSSTYLDIRFTITGAKVEGSSAAPEGRILYLLRHLL
jgi:hypothetical protein